jgi:hypothetical protein
MSNCLPYFSEITSLTTCTLRTEDHIGEQDETVPTNENFEEQRWMEKIFQRNGRM